MSGKTGRGVHVKNRQDNCPGNMAKASLIPPMPGIIEATLTTAKKSSNNSPIIAYNIKAYLLPDKSTPSKLV
jgi:hypothetical protein